jgi:hypothetical protein
VNRTRRSCLSPRKSLFLLLAILAPAIACAPAADGSHATAPPPPPRSLVDLSPRPAEPPQPADPDDAAVQKAGQEYLDLLVEIAPESATALGLHKNDAELDDRSVAGFDKAVDREEAMLKSLKERFTTPKLSAPGRTDLTMLIGALEVGRSSGNPTSTRRRSTRSSS